MRDLLEQLLRAADVPNPELAETLWAEYRAGGAGAERAFATLLAWYGGGIYRRIWGFVRSDAADDVFQDVLAKLHRERAKLETFEHALRWLRTVAVTQAVDAHRRAKRRRAREAKAARTEADAAGAAERSRDELQEAIAAALGRLTDAQRQAVALHYFEGLDKRAAAAVMGVSRDTFARRLEEALTRLGKLLPPPAVLAAGGVATLPAALSAHSPALPAGRVAELVQAAWSAPAPGWPWAKAAAAAVVLGGAGLGVAAIVEARRPEAPPPTPAPPAPPRVEAPRETAADRNLRVFHAELKDKVSAALRRLAPAGGAVEVEAAEAFDTRLDATFLLRPPAGRPGRTSRVRFILETKAEDRDPWVLYDADAGGVYRRIDLDRPIVLGKNPLTGKPVTLSLPGLEEAVRVLRTLPRDELTAADYAAHAARLRAVVEPYAGGWYREGDPNKPCRVGFDGDAPQLTAEPGAPYGGPILVHVRYDGGRVRALPVKFYDPVRLTTAAFHRDGTRIDFPEAKTFWLRTPAKK